MKCRLTCKICGITESYSDTWIRILKIKKDFYKKHNHFSIKRMLENLFVRG